MPQSTSESQPHIDLPHVLCARCGTRMRLLEITPNPADRYEIQFTCECGWDYHMTASIAGEDRAH